MIGADKGINIDLALFGTNIISGIITRGEKGTLHVKCHALTYFCNSGGYLPYILLETLSSVFKVIVNSSGM